MDALFQYNYQHNLKNEAGELPASVNPGEPADESTDPLTPTEIQQVRSLLKEISERFNPPPAT